ADNQNNVNARPLRQVPPRTQPTAHSRQPTLEDLWNSPRLTAVEVARLDEPGVHRVDDNLYLQVKSGRSWLHRYMLRGKARASGLGSLRYVTLAEARSRKPAPPGITNAPSSAKASTQSPPSARWRRTRNQ